MFRINRILTFELNSGNLIILLILFVFGIFSCSMPANKKESTVLSEKTIEIYTPPDTSTIPKNELGEMIRYGLVLIQNTSYFIGPEGVSGKNLRNKMNCTNCHLQNGTKPYGLNFFSTHDFYPQFRARENKVLSLAERVNNCIERPHNGIALALDSREMIAIISYIKWIGDGYSTSSQKGHGLRPVAFESLSADPKRGEAVYIKHCKSCHQANGEGLMNPSQSTYIYPPLWGEFSYQESSSMHRVIKAASFIKYNMPNTVNWEKPLLSDQEALDVAAFINDGTIHSRPKSKYISYPNNLYKPIDYFKGPYMDSMSEKTHAFGPWDSIIKFYEMNKLSPYF